MVIMDSSPAPGLSTHLRCDSEVSEPRDRVHAKEGISDPDQVDGPFGSGNCKKGRNLPI